MSALKVQRILIWVLLCTNSAELLLQQFGETIQVRPSASGVSAFTIPSSSSSSSSLSWMTRTQPHQFHALNAFQIFTPSLRQQISRSASTRDENEEANGTSTSVNKKSSLPFYLDPNTKGGVVVLTFVLFLGTYLTDQIFINVLNYDEIDAGITIGMGFTVLSTLAWMSTYLFRVATKDMTYAKQLKDYENAVIAKRLEELDDDEVQALVEEVSKDSF